MDTTMIHGMAVMNEVADATIDCKMVVNIMTQIKGQYAKIVQQVQ